MACCSECGRRLPKARRPRKTWPNAELVAEVKFLLLEGLSLDEIAEQLGMRPASIERAFQRARDRDAAMRP